VRKIAVFPQISYHIVSANPVICRNNAESLWSISFPRAVENSLYGEIRATLNLCNRYDVDNFIRQAADAPESLLSRMTGGVHLHTLRCPDKDTFARIRDALEQQGLLYRKE